MTFEFRPSLTAKYILTHVSEEEIFAKYGVPVQTGSFCSPLRKDRSPTCVFYRAKRSNKLFLRDWAGYFHGDCFDLAGACPPRLDNFDAILKRVAADFGLLPGNTFVPDRQPLFSTVQIEKQLCEIGVRRRPWNDVDREFWGQWDFKGSTLELYHVTPVERVWVDGSLVYTYINKLDVGYVYHFGEYDYKVYFPRRQKYRFLHNNAEIVQGYIQLPPTGDACIITKSLKDVMKLHEFNIAAVAPMSESQMLSNDMLNDLTQRFTTLFSLYDNDRPGKRTTARMRREQGMIPLLMPKGYPKDFTDFYNQRGYDSTLALIETLKSQLL
jgi:hypothetical protein